MKPLVTWLFVCWGSLMAPHVSFSQNVRIDLPADEGRGDSGYASRWDSSQDRLIIYRDVSIATIPAARVFTNSGTSVPFYPLKDLPEAQRMTIWGAAATPEGGLVLSAIAEYGPREVKPVPVKSLLLTYYSSGKLERMWEVKPYHFHHVAVDREGNVFALGSRGDLKGAYPLLIKYSATGKILREMLPSSTFSTVGDEVVLSGSPHGESEMFIENGQLYVWLAPVEELLRFSLAGDLLGRESLSSALKALAAQTGFDHTQVLWLGVQGGKLIAQLQLWPKDTTRQRVKVAMVSLTGSGLEARLLTSPSDGPSPGHFIGASSDEKLLFVELDGNVAVMKRY